MKVLGCLLGFVALLACLAVALVVAAVVFINPIARRGIETFAPRALGVPITVREVMIRPFRGRAQVKGFRIANLPGYSEQSVVALGEFEFDMDIWTLFGNRPLVINKIELGDLAISYEVLSGVGNVEALRKRIAAHTRWREAWRQEAPRQGRKIVIERFISRGGQLLYTGGFTAQRAVAVALPEIYIRDLGRDSGGVTPAEALRRIVGEILSGVGESATSVSGGVVDVGGRLPENAGGAVPEGPRAVGDDVQGLIK